MSEVSRQLLLHCSNRSHPCDYPLFQTTQKIKIFYKEQLCRYIGVIIYWAAPIFAANLFERNCTIWVDCIDALCAAAEVKQRQPFLIDALVVLLEHKHTVWTLKENDADYSGLWREIKRPLSAKFLHASCFHLRGKSKG